MVISSLIGKRLLFIGAHPDDIELGCGATLARYAAECDVFCVILSRNAEYPKIEPKIAEQAVVNLSSLGVQPHRISFGKFRTRHFQVDRQAIADELVRLRKDLTPDIVFSHSTHDLHQDHIVVHDEVRRVFRQNILSFEIIRSSMNFEPTIFISVSEAEAHKKVKALRSYAASFNQEYFTEGIQLSHLRLRGLACNVTYAEGFEAFRLVMGD